MDINNKTLTVNGREVAFSDERNLLEVIRKAGIDIPTFCYHSELSIYGACRLCIVEVQGRGIMASCSTPPEPGLVVHTDSKELRETRKVNIELLLANHNRECPTCARSSSCALQNLARRLGVEEIRYKQREAFVPIDNSSPSLTRDPNKCVLCGDCVRVCREVQGIGAIDFAHRGAKACVAPAFGQDLAEVECVNCGQCAAVCPTGAIIPKQVREEVWTAIHDTSKTVVVQVAPAVRFGLGEYFGLEAGANVAGKLVAALKLMGFKQVYDTCFSADMTIFEEATEFIDRFSKGGKLPMFTSCCPAWVKYAEIYYPELLPNVSTCKSPQQMFGKMARKTLPEQLAVKPEDLVVVSIMPCTAKKYEAQLTRHQTDGRPDVDIVLTTQEIGRMINSMGIQFNELEPEAFDMPMGFSTSAGLIFGATGGVMEAALRYAVEKLEGHKLQNIEFKAVRGLKAVKDATLKIGEHDVKVAVVHGLANAKILADKVAKGEADYHFIEVMACPGGCVSGAGQPYQPNDELRAKRAKGVYSADKCSMLQKSQDNYMVETMYKEQLGGGPGTHAAHEALHTHYSNRSQLFDAKIPVMRGDAENRVPVTVTICANRADCPGKLLLGLLVDYVKGKGWSDRVDIDAAFSSRQRVEGTIGVTIGDSVTESCEFTNALNTEEKLLNCREFEALKRTLNQAVEALA